MCLTFHKSAKLYSCPAYTPNNHNNHRWKALKADQLFHKQSVTHRCLHDNDSEKVTDEKLPRSPQLPFPFKQGQGDKRDRCSPRPAMQTRQANDAYY
ncbi:hypothetical protein BaRGS_00028303 [Batillaria attramentaria]|uniref:Uncharacterized protein n=1 Tax=Batillaria attramentaria TaxID=370345 RepID=A0ABD0JZH2_9CAEN